MLRVLRKLIKIKRWACWAGKQIKYEGDHRYFHLNEVYKVENRLSQVWKSDLAIHDDIIYYKKNKIIKKKRI